MVPLDYISANGQPAGFNVALLTEIGKLLKINIEFVA
jgi:ABC-type amino acid transport substrate-binding protein